jgi:hypothetical protein
MTTIATDGEPFFVIGEIYPGRVECPILQRVPPMGFRPGQFDFTVVSSLF